MNDWMERRIGQPEHSVEGGPRRGCQRTVLQVWADPCLWPTLMGPRPWHSAVHTAKSTHVC